MNHVNMILKDLEKPRSPVEMKLYLSEVRAAVHSSREVYNAALQKKGRFKEFLEEFYPLYCFSQTRFCTPDSRLHIVLGNQGYDAIIESSFGDITTLEITSYIDGKKDYLDSRSLIQRGYGESRLGGRKSLDIQWEEYLELIIKNAHKKRIRSYHDSDLLIVVDTYHHFGVLNLDDNPFVSNLKSELSKIRFQARNVFLLILDGKTTEPNDDNINEIHFLNH